MRFGRNDVMPSRDTHACFAPDTDSIVGYHLARHYNSTRRADILFGFMPDIFDVGHATIFPQEKLVYRPNP